MRLRMSRFFYRLVVIYLRDINLKEKENATNPQEGSLAQAEKWSDGKWKETGEPETCSPRSLWKSSRPAQEGLRELAGSLIIAAALGGTQRAHFLRTEAGGWVGTIALPPWSLPQQPQDRLPVHLLGHQQGLPGESPAPWADKKEAPYLADSFLPKPLAPPLWKEAGASAVPWAERKLSQQEGICSTQTSESSVAVLVSINDAETFLKWLISPFPFEVRQFLTFSEQNGECPFAKSFCSREMSGILRKVDTAPTWYNFRGVEKAPLPQEPRTLPLECRPSIHTDPKPARKLWTLPFFTSA